MTPDKYTIAEHFIDVGQGHSLYVQDWGNSKAGRPILFLHGGPGSSAKDHHKSFFEPTSQRVIFFDQRGTGRSLPAGSLEHNTTKELVEDIETIAKKLNLKKFIITGGSWGSCLALAYAARYPSRIKAMVLRGIYTGTAAENDHIDSGGWKTYFPDVWQAYLERTPNAHHSNPTAYHHRMALGSDPQKAKFSAYAYSELESSLLRLDDRYTPQDFETFDPNGMKIELHYLSNNCFLPNDYILKNAPKLTMPIWLIQGRYDMVCPPITAYNLNQVLPNSQLIWTTAGHANDRPNYDLTRSSLLQLTSQA